MKNKNHNNNKKSTVSLKKKTNPFDLENIEDLSEMAKKAISKKSKRQYRNNLLSLFEMKEALTIEEVIVAMERLYSVTRPRNAFITNLNNLIKLGTIIKADLSYFKK